MADELEHFLMVYKQLEHKKVSVEALRGHNEAKKVISQAIKNFNLCFKE